MQHTFEEFEEERYSDLEIFTKIWSHPFSVLRFIHAHQYEKNMYWILFLAGIVNALDRASIKNMADSKSLAEILIGAAVIGGLLGWISIYFYASLVSWTGSWINGQGKSSSLYRIFAYSMIPSITTLSFTFILLVLFGSDVFSSNFEVNFGDYATAFIYYSISLLSFGLSIYSIVLCVIGTAIVQNFSIGKAIANLLLPVVILVIIFIIIYLLIELFR